MKLVKVRDNQNRPINKLDVMVGAIFGDNIPKEFIQDKYYRAGEHVYAFDSKGRLNVWICNINGKFKTCKEPNFSEWSLDKVIEQNSRPVMNMLGEAVNPVMYECKSGVSAIDFYTEENQRAYFRTIVGDFNLADYTGENDIVDIYLRREHSDHYLRKEDYRLVGRNLSVELPLDDMVDEKNVTTKFLPEGETVASEEGQKFWYGEDGVIKTINPVPINGVQERGMDLVVTANKSIEYGYKLHDLKIKAVHTVVGSPLNDQLIESGKPGIYRLDEILIENHDPIGNKYNDDVQVTEITIPIEPDRDVYDTLTVEYDKNTQLVNVLSENGYIQQVQFEVTVRKDKPLSIFMIGSKAVSPMCRFIKVLDDYGTVETVNGEKLVKLPKFDLLRYNSFEFELYVNRVFRSDYEEVIDENTGEMYIRMTGGLVDYDTDTFLFHIFYSISQDAAIIKTHDEKKVTKDKEAFRLMLSTTYVNKFQWLKMREDSKLVPPECTVGSRNTANITDPEHYLSVGQTLKADTFSMVFTDNIVRRAGSETDICNSESYPILKDTKRLVIPFVDYDSAKDDFLIFKSGGVLLSTAKWYCNGENVNLYVHESPIYNGDYVDFRLLDRDDTVRVDNYFLDVNVADHNVDTGVELDNTAFHLLFTISGEYISPSKYTINGSTITFKTEDEYDQPYVPTYGSRVELVVGMYKHDYSRTLYKMIQIEATDDGQREFYLDDGIEYNPDSDNLLIFRKDGLYIGERFYHTDEAAGKIIIDAGSGVPLGSYIDILLIRNMSVKVMPNTEVEEN